MGCLLAVFVLISPRLGMVAIWLLTDWEDRVFNSWVIPLLGIIFVPWTTVLYTIGYIVSGDTASPWGIMGLIIGVFLDMMSCCGLVETGPQQLAEEPARSIPRLGVDSNRPGSSPHLA
ncbi:MAG: hypothetical protein WD895_08965 [Acidimicrobiia bacterium]